MESEGANAAPPDVIGTVRHHHHLAPPGHYNPWPILFGRSYAGAEVARNVKGENLPFAFR